MDRVTKEGKRLYFGKRKHPTALPWPMKENDLRVESRLPCCIWHEFNRVAIGNPQQIAVIHAASSGVGAPINREGPPVYEGDQYFTFAQVSASVNSLSCRLLSILDGGGDPFLIGGDSSNSALTTFVQASGRFSQQAELEKTLVPKIVGLYMPPSVEYIISVLSVLRCGAAFLPLDPSWPKDRILSVINLSNPNLVIGCDSLFIGSGCQPLHKSHWLVKCIDCPLLRYSMEESIEECCNQSTSVLPCGNQVELIFCYLMYTSGSNGKPKGVCGTEKGLLNRFRWMREMYPPIGKDVVLFKTSTSFVDHLQEFLGALLTACTLVTPPFSTLKGNVMSIIDFLQPYSINRLTVVPSFMRLIIPALGSQRAMQISSSLQLIIFSGEILPISLWKMLKSLLPETTILNLYGSTEVSGDCMYFDCKRLPWLLEREKLTSVPIGLPLSDCFIVLDGSHPQEGEICVGGLCLSAGYFAGHAIIPLDFERFHRETVCVCPNEDCGSQVYFRTGDLARRLSTGDLMFLGRRNRTIKVNGQRVALEEVEGTLREHPVVVDCAVIHHKSNEKDASLVAFIQLKDHKNSDGLLENHLRNWMRCKLPISMAPNHFVFLESLPKTAGGKVDYDSLGSFEFLSIHIGDKMDEIDISPNAEAIKKAFCDALLVGSISDHDDFFVMGGNSLSAAHVAHNLRIDMNLLYAFPTPSKLLAVLNHKEGSQRKNVRRDGDLRLTLEDNADASNFAAPDLVRQRIPKAPLRSILVESINQSAASKRLKVNEENNVGPTHVTWNECYPWNFPSIGIPHSCSRCNKVMGEEGYQVLDKHIVDLPIEVPRNEKGYMQEEWKVYMNACVDSSPVLVLRGSDVYLFIGSHSHKFLCVDAKSGFIKWETSLGGRVEGTAAIAGDFSQVVVGCYDGNIYFLDFLTGRNLWTFQTAGEVKCQPITDVQRQLVWCGSHDHNLYALDYKKHACLCKIPCGGSIFGSPAIDEVRFAVYVASTSGRLIAVSIEECPFNTLWIRDLKSPIFGSLGISSQIGYVICCLVDGHVLALDSSGSVVWKYRTGGPVFAGASMSKVLSCQLIICSRNGSVYSIDLEKGELLWEVNVGDPITSSAYIEEHLHLTSRQSTLAYRLICVCSSSGVVSILRVNLDTEIKPQEEIVQKFADFELGGDVFSSPVMIGGKIFVGGRDDHLHCLAVKTRIGVEQ